MQDVVTIRPYQDGDEVMLHSLYDDVLGENYSKDFLAYWNWKFKENPVGKPIYWVAEARDNIVGQYVIIPIKLKIHNQVVTGYQSVDTMTHPNYRHQGIFENLAKSVYEVADESIIYGFPNHNSYPIFVNKLAWNDLGTIDAMVRPVFIPSLAKYYVTKITDIDYFDDSINTFNRSEQSISVVKDKQYLNWRYHAPYVKFKIYLSQIGTKIMGYIVIKCEYMYKMKIGRIYDLGFADESIGLALIDMVMKYCRTQKAKFLFYRLIAPSYNKMLHRSGFVKLPIRNNIHFIVRANNILPWFVQTGDADTL